MEPNDQEWQRLLKTYFEKLHFHTQIAPKTLDNWSCYLKTCEAEQL